MTRINVGMIKNSYVSETIRKINYIPREKKMRNTTINTTIIDNTMTLRATISIIEIEIRREFDIFDSLTSNICNII